MKRVANILLVGVMAFFVLPSFASYAGEVNLIIDKLIEKKILTQEEGKQLLDQVKSQKEKEATKSRQYTKQVAQEEVKASVPEFPAWVKNTKLKGDIRLRYQSEDRDNINVANETNRERYRLRWRFGLENKINDQWLAGFGLCSGSDDPRSTNQTFENTFQSPDARIDYAFARYTPTNWMSLIGGKYSNPLWQTKDLLWDTDITTDGITMMLKPKISKEIEPWISASWFILDEFSKANDPNMVAFQAGAKFVVSEWMEFKFGPSYYLFNNLKDNLTLEHASAGNTTYSRSTKDPRNSYRYSYDGVGLDGSITFYKLAPFVQRVSLFGQYVKSDADREDTGYLYGVSVGTKKVQKLGDWELKYNYRKLEADAWPAAFPDSDFYGGATNVKGHELELTLGIKKYVTLGFDYYKAKPIKKLNGLDPYNDEKLLQVDLVVKW